MRAKIKWWKSLVARPSAADRVLRMERAGPPPTRSHDARRARYVAAALPALHRPTPLNTT